MADRLLEFLNNLLKLGKEQLFQKSTFLRNKVFIKPVLGLTGLGLLLMTVRPLLTSKEDSDREEESTKPRNEKPDTENRYTIQKTLYLMKEKEKLLRKQEAAALQQQKS